VLKPRGIQKGAALVTGAARRIGMAIAVRLAEAGFDIALHASEGARSEALSVADRLAQFGGKVCVITGDLADAARCSTLVPEAAEYLGPLRLLVNNAAIFEADSAGDIDLDRWERHFAINLRAPVLLSSAFAAQVPAEPAGQDASIVNLIDQRVLRPTPQYFSYTLAKSALWMATRTTAQSFAERGIRVNAIGPGPVLPNAHDGGDGFTKEVEGVPLHRPVDPGDIADAVLYLAGARGVTGQMIAVDAGQHLGWRTPDVLN